MFGTFQFAVDFTLGVIGLATLIGLYQLFWWAVKKFIQGE